jgi:hypothetical protein
MVEVDRTSRNVIFEATITAPTAPFGITFHRVERLLVYARLTPTAGVPALSAVRGYFEGERRVERHN